MCTPFVATILLGTLLLTNAPPENAGITDTPAEPKVLRIDLPALLGPGAAADVQVHLFHRDGRFYHGYALCPRRDRLVHPIEVVPSRPIAWEWADGRPLVFERAMRGSYSYTGSTREEFQKWRERYRKGEIRIVHPIPTPPLKLEGSQLTGHFDVLIAKPDEPNTPGHSSSNTAYRILIDAALGEDGRLKGQAQAWAYGTREDDYGQNNPRTRIEVSGGWVADHWKPLAGTEIAKGHDWPRSRGPAQSGAARDSSAALIDDLGDARLVWVSAEPLPGGRGASRTRGEFATFAFSWSSTGYGSFTGPILADGRLFQFVFVADEKLVAASEAIQNDVFVRLGVNPLGLANDHGLMRDTVYCIDARTGATLWRWQSQNTIPAQKEGKAGVAISPVWHDGRLYVRGASGLYALDAATGKVLWRTTGVRTDKLRLGYAPGGNSSRDLSPVLLGGKLLLQVGDGGLAALQPDTGALAWYLPDALGISAMPVLWQARGKDYLLVAGKADKPLRLLEPETGNVVWSGNALGPTRMSLLLAGDIVCGSASPDGTTGIAAARISLDGAEKLWTASEGNFPVGRSVPMYHRGHFYLDDRTAFRAVEAATGKVVARQPHIYTLTGGSHNWVWSVAANDRIFTSGMLMFSLAQDGFKRMPGRLNLDFAGGYVEPVKPIIVDGRFFARLGDKLVCYDLRKSPSARR